MNLKFNINKYIIALSIVFCNLLSFAQAPDSLKLPFNLGKDDNAPSIDLKDPSNVETKVVYDPITNQYKIVETIGDNEYRPSDNQDFDDFWENQNKQAEKEYWNQKKKENSGSSSDNGILDNVRIPGDAFESIFGSNKIEIKPQGSAELIFGVTSTKTENPIIRVQSQRVTSFDFDEKIQLNSAFFPYREPVHGRLYEELFQCDVAFEQDGCGFNFHRRYLEKPVTRTHAELEVWLRNSPAARSRSSFALPMVA